jgi:hypothetical protein
MRGATWWQRLHHEHIITEGRQHLHNTHPGRRHSGGHEVAYITTLCSVNTMARRYNALNIKTLLCVTTVMR